MIANGGIRMGGKVIEQHVAGATGKDGRFGLTVGNFVKGDQNGWIDGAGIIKESAADGLNALGGEGIKKGAIVGAGKLDFLTISRRRPDVGGMLR